MVIIGFVRSSGEVRAASMRIGVNRLIPGAS
jgi:hypothetical protein